MLAQPCRVPVPTRPDGPFGVVEPAVGKSKADRRYFACAGLRKFGSHAAFYSTGYWLDAKTNLVSAGRVHGVGGARHGDFKAAAEPRCDVGETYDIVN